MYDPGQRLAAVAASRARTTRRGWRRYRQAQRDRVARIDAIARQSLADREAAADAARAVDRAQDPAGWAELRRRAVSTRAT